MTGRIEFAQYASLAPSHGTRGDEIVSLALALMRRYNEPLRQYHNLGHIQRGYAEHEKFFGHMDPVTFFAWTYHDAIYDPKAKDNEEQSALLFEKDNETLGFAAEDAQRISALIRSTTHTGEKNVITDIDLSNLAIPPSEYDDNTRKIRAEYDFLSDDAWHAGRRDFLVRFLAAGPIFATPQFAAAYERQAVENMQRELSRLTGQIFPAPKTI
jgi:predicted metal-dependent HD superfamily phosphohydrolase